MSAAEGAYWRDFARRNGLPADRQEWVVANTGEYVGAVWGGRARARDLIPKFQRHRQPAAVVKAWFESLTPERFGNVARRR